ncbi:MAG: nucleotidyltransferase family protein [Candidatus Izimaplasma sp.]|nr:nucleotidyltransferase family protein [Candidatus Izimaplasma bacterium]
MVDGIVLAGGYSSRLGINKMSIFYKGEPVIVHTIKNMQKVCDRIIVVTGYYHKEISKIIQDIDSVEVVYNSNYQKGMFSSILTGIKKINNDFFIIPGDYPLVSETIYKKLLTGNKSIRVPSHNHKLGHPIFFEKQYRKLLLNTESDNLKSFRNNYDYEIINVEDASILFDVDTKNDVNKLKNRE